MEIIIVVVAKHLFRPIMSADIFLKDILIISELLNAQIMTDISNSIIIQRPQYCYRKQFIYNDVCYYTPNFIVSVRRHKYYEHSSGDWTKTPRTDTQSHVQKVIFAPYCTVLLLLYLPKLLVSMWRLQSLPARLGMQKQVNVPSCSSQLPPP